MHGAALQAKRPIGARHYEHTKTSRPNHGQQQRLWPIDGGDTRAERIFRVFASMPSWREKCRRGGQMRGLAASESLGAGSLRDGRDGRGVREQVRRM